MYGYIYKTTNLVNGKIYIGQKTSKKFLGKKYLGSGSLLQDAIKKYGKDNFTVELLDECESRDDLDEREKYWIAHYNLPNLKIGYNITYGGQLKFFTGCTHTEKAKLKMSERAKARPHPPTTLGWVWLVKDDKRTTVKPDEVESYINDGWKLGRDVHVTAWNKGLTEETSESVAKMHQKRREKFARGESIGCFGLVGDANFKRKSDSELIESILNNGFENIWREFGKSYCKTYFHINQTTLERCLKLANIVETEEHKLYVRNKNRKHNTNK